jgi:hypothetical protein
VRYCPAMTKDRATPAGTLPDFFIVGAPKCGTTAMYEYLRQHPGIFLPFHKEPLYFGSDLTRRYGAMTEADYRSLFADARPGQRIGEASAWYLYSERAAQEIKDAVPHASIIVMLRNPVDVMYAQHSQLLFTRQENLERFEDAVEAEEARSAGRRLPPGPIRVENLLYRRTVRFAEQLERYVDVFGRDAIHVIFHEDLVADTPAAYRRVLEFLNVDPTVSVDFSPVNENKRVRAAWLQRLIWDPPVLKPLIPRLRRLRLAHAARAALLRLNSDRQRRAPMDPTLRRRLSGELAPEIERLGALVGRDLSGWIA